jgi:plasmid stabilization system protein ParE
MSDTLAQLITKLQALLIGDSDTFSTATCTAAIRQALKDLNLAVPQHAAETQDAAAEQYEYELEDETALQIVDVLLEGTDLYADINTSLEFDQYFEDDRLFFRLRTPQGEGDTLIIRYTKPYTINGLDSETASTLPALYDVVLLDGAAWKACLVRAAGRVETINMSPDVSKNFQVMAEQFRLAFEAGLANLKRRKFPVSEPSTQGWSDEWEGQY